MMSLPSQGGLATQMPLVPPQLCAARMDHSGRVVVASESELARRELRKLLAREAYAVEEARSALDVLRLAGVAPGQRADAVVLDVSGSSWATLELLAVLTETGAAPVLALVDRPEQRRRCLELGARAVLDLPIDGARIRNGVRRVLAARHLSPT
jgi:DNA-binding response OmpR family regulator